MATHIDPRLLKIIRAAGESDQVEAILVAKEDGASSPTADDGGPARRMIEGAIEGTGDLPVEVRYFPRANAAVISASGRFIQAILQSEELAVASATEIDVVFFLGGE